jgi:hypothetical protein
VGGRGLYADDFVFGWLAETHTYTEAVAYWHREIPAGGRLLLAVITPAVYGAFCAQELLDSHLGAFHSFLVIVHVINAAFVWRLARHYRLGPLASGAAALLFLLHPSKDRAVLWPAAAYGYGIPLLLFLVGWLCLLDTTERPRRRLFVGYAMWAAAALAIEQFVVAEVALLAWWTIVGYRRGAGVRHRIAGLAVIAALFLAVHFLFGGTTEERLSSYGARNAGGERGVGYLVETAKILVWRLLPLPSHSAHEEAWRLAREGAGHPFILAGLGAAVIGMALWAWPAPTNRGKGGRAAAAGGVVAVAALLPFLLLGMGAGPPRGMLLVMVGLALVAGGAVEGLLSWARSAAAARASAAVIVALFACAATVSNAGYQVGYRQVWGLEQNLLREVARHTWHEGDRVVVEGLPKGPFVAQLFEDSWGLYHALRWITHVDDIDGWTARMPEARPESADGRLITLHAPVPERRRGGGRSPAVLPK